MRNLKCLLHTDDRDDLSAQNDDLLVLDRLDIRRLNVDRTVDRGEWDGVHLLLHANKHRLNDGKSQRQLDLKDRAFIDVCLDIHVSRECFDLTAHNVHTDAASGDVCNLFRCREPRQEDQANGIRIVEAVRLTLRNHSLLDRLSANLVRINARTVIRDHDDDVISLMTRNESDLADARFPLCLTRIGALNTVVEGVAQKVHDRIPDLIDNGAVKLCLLALDGEVDLLPQFLGHIAHHTRESVEHSTDRNHTDLHNNVLQVARHAVHLLERLHKIAHAMRLSDLFKTHLVDDQLTHEVHQSIKFFNIDTDALTLMRLLRRGRRFRACLLRWSCRLLRRRCG